MKGANYIATGHYVRLKRNEHGTMNSEHAHCSLLITHGFKQETSHIFVDLKTKTIGECLSIGDHVKPEVRKMAKNSACLIMTKRQSGVCFIGLLDMKDFLTKYIKPKNGRIIYKNKQMRIHDGVYYYLSAKGTVWILASGADHICCFKDIKNIIYVGDEKDLLLKNKI